MIKRFLSAAALCLYGHPVLAQAIPVQSGDHFGFTRLVLPIGADREWQLSQQTETRWVLSLTPSIEGFDLSGAFDLIQRTRLAELTDGESLSLDLACDCNVESFRFNDRFLVIDILDPERGTVQDEPATVPDAEADLDGRASAAAALPDLADLLIAPSELPQVPVRPQPRRGGVTADDAPSLETALQAETPNPRLAEAAEIMAEQLARAAASGLLDVSLRPTMTSGDAPPQQPQTNAQLPRLDVSETEPAEDVLQSVEINEPTPSDFPPGPLPIRAETALDAAVQLHSPIGPPRTQSACDGTSFDLRDWASGDNFSDELGELHQDLFNDRDELMLEAASRLARYYLHYGFGAEALYWLSQTEQPPDDLVHVAALVDGAISAPFPIVDAPESCSPGQLLWRYLAGSIVTDLTSDDTAALQRAHGELPAGLRDLLGPRLARQLAQDGHQGAARNIRDALFRGRRLDATTLGHLDFDLGIAPAGLAEETRTDLTEALRDDGGDPVAVMVHALAFDRSIGERPLPSRLIAAEALLREAGDGSGTGHLWHEIVLGYAALGQIDRALTLLDDPTRLGSQRTQAVTDLIADRIATGDTAALVILAYTHGADWRPEGSAAGRVQVQAIDALRNAGLFEAAQILRDVRRPLILPSPEPENVEPDDENLLAWRDGDWSRLAQSATGAFADVAARMANLDTTPASPPVPQSISPDLDALAATVIDSRALRATLSDLLSSPTPR